MSIKFNKPGSVEYQIILLTKKIEKLQNHLRINKHDYSNKQSLLKLISKRKKKIKYLKNK